MAALVDNTKTVYQGQPPAGTTASTLYTAVGNGEMIKEIWLTNVSTSAATITLYKVPSGNTAGPANAIVYQYSIPVGSFSVVAAGTDMAVGDFIAGCQGTGSAITVTITNYQK